ncbi:MAG: S-methyl-5'-thioadenosine phosphorylase [Candidatus Marinimicrobia bacterium]|nr:S-methyl-5'-thioadenosine phosphorylase [Candidatus Neomarinimicrobiota bacterium]|tara:strand:- start:3039 stop:3809 length:771 start_codon:yes stop_codon:yes gene_type:complete
MKTNLKIGIIGGSGMEDPAFISNFNTKKVLTPYGDPSSELIIGNIENVSVVIISRHGLNHSINPTNINYRANIWALKEEGCSHILAVTACGSMRKKIEPGHFVFPDQFIDRTTKRIMTFFDGSDVKHTSMGNPFNIDMRICLAKTCEYLGFKYHDGGTIITIEGPRFSTKAESMMFRSWGCDIINMSTVPEIVLARELNLNYQSVAMATDYDCWHESEEEVTMEMIYAVMKKNVKNVKKLIELVIPLINKHIAEEG